MNPADVKFLDWAKGDGLLPAVVQSAASGAVLMLGYMDRDALKQTLATGSVTFFSRRRQTLWVKGESSGNILSVIGVSADCDGDAILVQAIPAGPVCHEGRPTCFRESLPAEPASFTFLAKLESVIADRIEHASETSYTSKLHAEGPRRIAQKVGEEGLEVALATLGGSDSEVLSEAADLVFHLVLLLHERGLSLARVAAELERRHEALQASAELNK